VLSVASFFIDCKFLYLVSATFAKSGVISILKLSPITLLIYLFNSFIIVYDAFSPILTLDVLKLSLFSNI
jgi:hypothetical protein